MMPVQQTELVNEERLFDGVPALRTVLNEHEIVFLPQNSLAHEVNVLNKA